jgi:DUF1009 family protein
MIASGATALAIDAQRCLVFDKEEIVEAANAHNIAIVALPPLAGD